MFGAKPTKPQNRIDSRGVGTVHGRSSLNQQRTEIHPRGIDGPVEAESLARDIRERARPVDRRGAEE